MAPLAESLTVPPAYDIPLDLTEVPMGTLSRLYQTYGKTIMATVLAVATVAQTASSDHNITRLEWVQIATALVAAVGVYWVPDHPRWPGVKTAVAFLTVLLGAAATVITTGGGSGSWPQLALAALTVVFVGAAPARSTVATSRAG